MITAAKGHEHKINKKAVWSPLATGQRNMDAVRIGSEE